MFLLDATRNEAHLSETWEEHVVVQACHPVEVTGSGGRVIDAVATASTRVNGEEYTISEYDLTFGETYKAVLGRILGRPGMTRTLIVDLGLDAGTNLPAIRVREETGQDLPIAWVNPITAGSTVLKLDRHILMVHTASPEMPEQEAVDAEWDRILMGLDDRPMIYERQAAQISVWDRIADDEE